MDIVEKNRSYGECLHSFCWIRIKVLIITTITHNSFVSGAEHHSETDLTLSEMLEKAKVFPGDSYLVSGSGGDFINLMYAHAPATRVKIGV